MTSPSNDDDGGYAFPRPLSTDEHVEPCNIAYAQNGMTLRDYFAAQVLAAICHREFRGNTNAMIDTAVIAYEFADAMIAVRSDPT